MEAQQLLQSPGLMSRECFWWQVAKTWLTQNAVGMCYVTAKKVQRQSRLQGGLIQHLDNSIKGPVPTPFHAQHWPCSQAGWERVTAALSPATPGEEERPSFHVSSLRSKATFPQSSSADFPHFSQVMLGNRCLKIAVIKVSEGLFCTHAAGPALVGPLRTQAASQLTGEN